MNSVLKIQPPPSPAGLAAIAFAAAAQAGDFAAAPM